MRASSVKPEAFNPDAADTAMPRPPAGRQPQTAANEAKLAAPAAPSDVRPQAAAHAAAPVPKGGFSARLKAVEGEVREQEYRREQTVKSDAAVRRRLSALKALSPLMLALIKRPGYDAEDGELHAAVQQLRTETERASKDLLGVLGADDAPPWLAGSAASVVAEAVAAEWVAGAPVLDMSPYQPIWGHLADCEFTEFAAAPADAGAFKDGDMMVRLSMLKAMSQVVATTRRSYLMRHDPEKLYPLLSGAMLEVAKTNLAKLVDNQASEAARVMALQSLIGKCAEVLCAHWDNVVRPTVEKLRSMEKRDRLDLYRRHPDGLPLDGILKGFSADVTRIVAGLAEMDPRAKLAASITAGE